MTNDNFTDAARAEAERKHPVPASYDPGVSQYERLLAQGAFRNGAEWARAHLAAQEPTTAAVEAFQDCLYERTLTWVPGVEVRAALSAARAARRDEEA